MSSQHLTAGIISFIFLLSVTGCGHEHHIETGSKELSTREEVSCDFTPEDLFVLTFGQSNAANTVDRLMSSHNPDLFEIHNNHCYLYQDPSLGATHYSGSTWAVLGDLVVAASLKKVYFVNIAVSGSAIENWIQGNVYHDRLIYALNMSQELGFSYDFILFHQGETDALNGTSYEDYYQHFMNIKSVIRGYTTETPIYIAQVSRTVNQVNPVIRSAQSDLAANNVDIFAGPDTDVINDPGDRYDGTHFSAQGAVKHAASWYDSLFIN